MNCNKVKKELELIFEGGQPGADALSHIKNCKKCRAEYDVMLKITGALSGLEDVKVPSGFNKGVWGRIGEPAPGLFNGIFKPVFVLSGAAAAALVLFMVFFAGPGVIKKQGNFASKPPAIKEQTAKKEIIKNQEPIAPGPQAPVTAQNNKAAPQQEKPAGVSPGNMPALVKSTGAEKDYFVRPADITDKISAASVTKRPVELGGPLVIKNNVIKPLAGQAMTVIYKVEDTCNVLIRVYNRKGEPVKTLVQALQGYGVYTVTWSGEDQDNRVVGDGIYVVQIKTCLTEQKIKAMVVK
jgi:hypothetical protein